MTQDEIIELVCQTFGGIIKKEERKNFLAFAKLIAEKEREACAKFFYDNDTLLFWGSQAAREIRARSKYD